MFIVRTFEICRWLVPERLNPLSVLEYFYVFGELNNTSGIIDIIDIQTKPDFSKEIEKRAMYYSKGFENYHFIGGKVWRGMR